MENKNNMKLDFKQEYYKVSKNSHEESHMAGARNIEYHLYFVSSAIQYIENLVNEKKQRLSSLNASKPSDHEYRATVEHEQKQFLSKLDKTFSSLAQSFWHTQTDEDKNTLHRLLHWTVDKKFEDYLPVADVLIRIGAKAKTEYKDEASPLNSASSRQWVNYLVARGADCNHTDNFLGRSPLMSLACNRERIDAAKRLLEHKATNPFAKNKDNETALSYAARMGNSEFAVELLKKVDELMPSEMQRQEFLNLPTRTPYYVNLRQIVEDKAQVKSRNDTNSWFEEMSPLMISALTGNPNTMATLLARKEIQANSKNAMGMGLLHCAAFSSILHCLDQVRDLKTHVNDRDYDGNTPLHWLIKGALLRYTGYVEAAKYKGEEEYRCIENLIKAGADLEAKNCYGRTPLDVILQFEHDNSFARYRSKNIFKDIKLALGYVFPEPEFPRYRVDLYGNNDYQRSWGQQQDDARALNSRDVPSVTFNSV